MKLKIAALIVGLFLLWLGTLYLITRTVTLAHVALALMTALGCIILAKDHS